MLIATERAALDVVQMLGDDDVVIASITAAELLVGVELASAARRAARAPFVDSVLSLVGVEAYDTDAARAHAGLLAHARRTGRPRGAHDLIIAAVAVATERTLVTADREGFDDLPGVRVALVPRG